MVRARLSLISLFRLFSEQPANEVPYSTFKTLMTEKRVTDLVIIRDHIKGTRVNAKDGEEDVGIGQTDYRIVLTGHPDQRRSKIRTWRNNHYES